MTRRKTDIFAMCRIFGHQWDPISGTTKRHTWGYPVYLRCARCGTERKDNYDIHGHLIQRTYEYPEGYKAAGEALSRDQIRMNVIKSLR